MSDTKGKINRKVEGKVEGKTIQIEEQFKYSKLPEELRLILEAGSLHRTASQRHLDALETLKAKGVAFKDIQNHLEKQMKKSTIYSKVLVEGKLDYIPIKKQSDNGVKWCRDIINFLSYLRRNWVTYDVKVGKVQLTEEEAKKREDKATQVADIKALERVVNLMADDPKITKELNEMIGALKAILL